MADFDPFSEPIKKNKLTAEYNLFSFQDHLLEWIRYVSFYWHEDDFINTSKSLTNIYIDCNGFFNDEERVELKKIHQEMKNNQFNLSKYDNEYQRRCKLAKQPIDYSPPENIIPDFYNSILEFRITIMRYLAEHNLLMKMNRTSTENIGSM